MEAFRTAFGFYSLGSEDSAKAAEISQGRKRFMSLISLITFALIVGAADTRDWVKGGGDVADNNGNTVGNLHWHVDLVTVGIERNIQDIYGSNTADVVYSRTDYMNRVKNQATFPNCVRGQPDPQPNPPPNPLAPGFPNLWCGFAVSQFNAKMDATYGLLIFAGILSFLAWILVQALSSGNVAVLSWDHSFKAIGVLMASSCFFAFVAVMTFVGSNVRDTFCTVLDPPNGDTSFASYSYCSYSDGFRVGIFGIVFSFIQTLLFVYWMPHTRGTASYSFSEIGNTANKSEYAAAAAPTTTFSGSSGYQDIGPTTSL